jgi:tripartite-type tricarboxylate transporter receptor subunit TctC
VTLLATTPYVLVAHPSVPASSVRELIAFAKAQPGKLNYASGGSGSAPHLIGEMFRTRAGINVVHIPYKGSSPAKIDLVAGRVQLFFTGFLRSLPRFARERCGHWVLRARDGRLRCRTCPPSRNQACPDST